SLMPDDQVGHRWRCTIALSVAVLLIGTPRPALQTRDLDVADRVIVAAKIYSLIQLNFAHWEGVSKAEVDATYREYVDQAMKAQTRNEFDLATLRFIASLKNGHTQFVDSQLDSRPLKFRLLEVENEWAVIASGDSRLARGTVVRKMDGKPV